MSGPAIKDDLLTIWKERLSHYAKIHSNEVRKSQRKVVPSKILDQELYKYTLETIYREKIDFRTEFWSRSQKSILTLLISLWTM